jgi:hypothetical protein
MPNDFKSFQDFYPHYLSEHSNGTCRLLHFIGSWLVLGILAATFLTQNWWLALLIPLAGYGFAWVGHFAFEKNKPATFRFPAWSLMGDWVMWWQLLTGRIPFDPSAGHRRQRE